MAGTLLNIVGALTALAAAVFWFMSARTKLPRLGSYWNYVPDHDPFFMAMQHGNRLNRTGAAFAGVSALCAAGAAILPVITGQG